MLQKNCRLEKFNGYRFYEKDILYDDYKFNFNSQIDIDLDYISSGFGIALIDSESFSIENNPDTYLFKIGYRSVSVYFSSAAGTKLLKQISCPDAITITENLKFTFKKNNKRIQLFLNDKLILDYTIDKLLDIYCIGYYSTANNIINNISIATNIPDNWIVNMANTQGGYIYFQDNSFTIQDCTFNAEIEQNKILLQPGTYYLNLKTSAVNNKNDIKYYVYKSVDDRYFDETKNLLNKKNAFTLYEVTEINVKIVGTNGKVADIILSKEKDADYVPTSLSSIEYDGSYIDIYLEDFNKITWTGYITKLPYHYLIEEQIEYGVILDNKTHIHPEDIPLSFNISYNFEFDCSDFMFYIYKDKKLIFSQKLLNITNKITIFKNMSAVITSLIFYKRDGEEININVQDENIEYVNANINGPILAVNNQGLPLDLSSSYRLCIYNNYNRYVFTNYEREYFITDDNSIKLSKLPLNKDDSIIVYGIKDDDYNLEDIYKVPEDNLNSIDLLTKNYDYIRESDVYLLDKSRGIIYLTNEQLTAYKMFIVDYLKKDSYCINYDYYKKAYRVDISSLNTDNKLLYDTSRKDNNLYQSNDYRLTDINGNIKGYIVLEGGV